MAAIQPSQIVKFIDDGSAERMCLFILKDVSAGDTLDLGPSGTGGQAAQFLYLKLAGLVSATGTTIAGVTITAPTGLTIPAGPSNDAVWLIVTGVSL